jgi:hypothetical protein
MYWAAEDVPFTSRTTTLNEELGQVGGGGGGETAPARCRLARRDAQPAARSAPPPGLPRHSSCAPARPKTPGQVEYVLSDKTGTLTQNVMGFVLASIHGRLYGHTPATHAPGAPAAGGGGDWGFMAAQGSIADVPNNTPHTVRPAGGRQCGCPAAGAAEHSSLPLALWSDRTHLIRPHPAPVTPPPGLPRQAPARGGRGRGAPPPRRRRRRQAGRAGRGRHRPRGGGRRGGGVFARPRAVQHGGADGDGERDAAVPGAAGRAGANRVWRRALRRSPRCPRAARAARAARATCREPAGRPARLQDRLPRLPLPSPSPINLPALHPSTCPARPPPRRPRRPTRRRSSLRRRTLG